MGPLQKHTPPRLQERNLLDAPINTDSVNTGIPPAECRESCSRREKSEYCRWLYQPLAVIACELQQADFTQVLINLGIVSLPHTWLES